MLYELSPERGIDPGLTERFLRSLPDVVDASVWFLDGDLKAHVTVFEEAPQTGRDLQAACMDALGLHQTPRDIVMFSARPPAQSDRRVQRAA